ncbi:MAG: T9SS type A sorting domain-containing protein [Chitinophagales bacterium]|nr:T9SS type A sorting domain-containing protein [Chitinophagales bacterium]
MKKIVAIIIAALPALLFAQSTERSVIAANGSFGISPGYLVSSTIGEVVVATGISPSVTLTQGFQQPGSSTVGIKDVATGLSVKAFPNPAKGLVTLQLNAPNAMALSVSVFDISGKQTALPVQQLQINGESTHAVDFSTLQAGNYYLQLQNTEGSLKQTIKVQKVD